MRGNSQMVFHFSPSSLTIFPRAHTAFSSDVPTSELRADAVLTPYSGVFVNSAYCVYTLIYCAYMLGATAGYLPTTVCYSGVFAHHSPLQQGLVLVYTKLYYNASIFFKTKQTYHIRPTQY